MLGGEIRNAVVERRVLRLLLRLLLRDDAHADAVDELASEQGFLAAQRDRVTDPVGCIVADAGAEDVEVGGVDDEALLFALEAENRL